MTACRRTRHCFALAVALLVPAVVHAQGTGETVIERGTVLHDEYLAGGNVDVDAEILGDLVAAGGRMDVNGRVAGDLTAAAGRLDVRADVGDDARLAGGSVTVDGRVGDHIAVAGGSVELRPGIQVGGRAWLAGGTVTVAGRLRGPVDIHAGEAILGGHITGPVNVTADHLRVLPGTRIDGDLRYRTPHEATIASDADIGGEVIFDRLGDHGARPPAPVGGISFAGLAFFVISLFLAGALLQAIVPRFVSSGTRDAVQRPLLSLGLGALVLFVSPVAIIVALALVVTIPLALAALALLPVALLVGYLVFAFVVAEHGARLLRIELGARSGRRLLAFAVALLALGLAQDIPWIGGLILLAALLIGTGAALLAAGGRRAAPGGT